MLIGEGMSPITVLVSCKSPAVAGIVEEVNGVWRTGW